MRLKEQFRAAMTTAVSEGGRLPFLVNDMVIEEQLCQMRCSYCLTEEFNLLMDVPDARLRITTDRSQDWLEILDLYHEHVDAPILRLSGGEFFWLKGSTEFVQEASKRYETVQVITNGVFLNERRIEALASMGNVQLNISLDGHTLELNRHRLPPKQAKLHDVIMRNLGAAAEAGLQIDIQSVLTDANYHGQLEFAEYLRARYAGRTTLYFFPVRGDTAERMGPPPGDHLMPLVDRYDEFASVLPPRAYVEHMATQLQTNVRTLGCFVPATMAQLFGQGDVSACPHAWVKPMGNLVGDRRLLLDQYGSHQHYDLFMHDRPRFGFCKTCATPSDVINLYFLDRLTLEEIGSTHLYSGPKSQARLQELKERFRPTLCGATAEVAGP
ncbi:radical SAM protein [Streptomyces niveiscabiei]|uniref:Radical SAM protein n=1 Tax=Streptomyces niveiscabiei TaxID=164115 RepID=A0ABW9HUN7_9ACTN|nr:MULTISPECIES: radical SAM protein [Streptomyces]